MRTLGSSENLASYGVRLSMVIHGKLDLVLLSEIVLFFKVVMLDLTRSIQSNFLDEYCPPVAKIRSVSSKVKVFCLGVACWENHSGEISEQKPEKLGIDSECYCINLCSKLLISSCDS